MYDVIIIGAGPAGASAALFAAKAGKKVLVLDDDRGVTKRALVENHYGVESVTGPELVAIGHKQFLRFGAELHHETVAAIAPVAGGVKVTAGEHEHEARHVVLATGMISDLAAKSGIATRDGTEPRIKTIVVVDAAGKTSMPGVWAAGTIAGVSMHTIVTAGDGAKVAINVVSELNGERWVDHDVLKQPV